jgi:hypothetical protein
MLIKFALAVAIDVSLLSLVGVLVAYLIARSLSRDGMNFGNIGFMELMVILVIVLALARAACGDRGVDRRAFASSEEHQRADQQIREPIRDALNDSRSSDRLPTGEATRSAPADEVARRFPWLM